MSWKPHINKVASKTGRTIATLKRMKRFLPQSILKMLYNSLILPHLNYGILAWGANPGRLVKLQKWAIRTISNSKYNAHTEPLFKKYGLLKLTDIYQIVALKFQYRYQNNTLPSYLRSIFSTSQPTSDLNTRNRYYVRLNQPRTTSASVSIRYKIPQLMLEIPNCITDKISTHSIDGFSKYVKNHIISNYHISCEIVNCYICEQAAETEN